MNDVEYISILERAVLAFEDLISNSYGVDGLHLNGDIASWEELTIGGKYEEWLMDHDIAFNAIKFRRESK